MDNKYNDDDTTREYIRNLIQTQLDLTDGDFVLSKDYLTLDDDLVYAVQLDGTYRTIDNEMTPCMIEDFLGTPEPLENYLVIDYSIPISFLVHIENNFTENKEYLGEFVKSMTGKLFVSDDYSAATNCDEITNTTNTVTTNGETFVIYTTNIYLLLSDKLATGNEVTYSIKKYGSEIEDASIVPITRNSAKGKTPETQQLLGDKEAKSIIRNSVWSTTLSFFIERNQETCMEFIKALHDPAYSQNQLFSMTITFFNGKAYALTYTRTVVIDEIADNLQIGSLMLYTITFKESAAILTGG